MESVPEEVRHLHPTAQPTGEGLSILRAAMAIGGLIVSFVLLRFAPAPFIWILFLWFAFLVYSAVASKNTSARFIFLNVGIIVLILGAYEVYLWTGGRSQQHDEYPAGIVSRHPILGYAPTENTVAAHRKTHGAEVDFDVVYSIDSMGLRVSPPRDGHSGKGSILFFGGSFTFGSGVNDEETMPYVTGTKTNGEYHIYNFAFRGYGAHQMMSALENGMVDSMIEEDPRYVLNEDGKAVCAGSFDEAGGIIPHRLKSELMKSKTAAAIAQLSSNRHVSNPANIELFAAVVGASRDIIETRYRDCEFHVVFWDSGEMGSGEIAAALNRYGLRVHH